MRYCLNYSVGAYIEEHGKDNVNIDELDDVIAKSFGVTSERKQETSADGEKYNWDANSPIADGIILFNKITVTMSGNTLKSIELEEPLQADGSEQQRKIFAQILGDCGLGKATLKSGSDYTFSDCKLGTVTIDNNPGLKIKALFNLD